MTAAFIPPLAWVAFRVTAVRALRRERGALHLPGPLLTFLCVLYAPSALDVVIPSVLVGYGVAPLLAVNSGVDSMTRTRLEAGDSHRVRVRVVVQPDIAGQPTDPRDAARPECIVSVEQRPNHGARVRVPVDVFSVRIRSNENHRMSGQLGPGPFGERELTQHGRDEGVGLAGRARDLGAVPEPPVGMRLR